MNNESDWNRKTGTANEWDWDAADSRSSQKSKASNMNLPEADTSTIEVILIFPHGSCELSVRTLVAEFFLRFEDGEIQRRNFSHTFSAQFSSKKTEMNITKVPAHWTITVTTYWTRYPDFLAISRKRNLQNHIQWLLVATKKRRKSQQKRNPVIERQIHDSESAPRARQRHGRKLRLRDRIIHLTGLQVNLAIAQWSATQKSAKIHLAVLSVSRRLRLQWVITATSLIP